MPAIRPVVLSEQKADKDCGRADPEWIGAFFTRSAHRSIQPTDLMEMIHPGGYFPALLPASHGPDAASSPFAAAVAARLRMDWAAAMEALDALASSGDPVLRAAAANEAAGVALLMGDAGWARESVSADHPLADAAGRGREALNLAVGQALAGEVEPALAAFEAADALFAEAGDEHGRVLAGASRAWAHVRRCELRDAWHYAADALRRARRTKDEHATAVGQMATGLVDHARGARGEARRALGEAVRGFARAGDVLRQVQCFHLLGEIAYDGEDPIRAGSLYRDGLALARQVGAQPAIDRLTLLFEHR